MRLLLFTTICTAGILHSQIALQEDFTAPFNPAANGWKVQNSSSMPNLGNSWFQGSVNSFSSFNGSPDDFLASNFLAINGNVPGTISTWLITPTLNIVNGAVLQFATRTIHNPSSHPDRLEVYFSTSNIGAYVGASASFNSVGTFSNLLISINPSLTSTGYPNTWTVYTATISGVPVSTTGRIAFRHYVTNAGSTYNSNSDYIGLDAVQYTLPACNVGVTSFTTCAGESVTLAANGTSGVTYTWFPGSSNTNSIVVSPTSTTIYTVLYTEGGNQCPAQTATVTIGNQLSINLSVSQPSVCPNKSATLIATGPATSYTWNNQAFNSASLAVLPSSTTIYTVIGASGTNCIGSNTILLSLIPQPNISQTINPVVNCAGKSLTLTGSGGSAYLWLTGPTTGFVNNPQILTPSGTGARSYTLIGYDAFGCSLGQLVNFTISPSPVISAIADRTFACTNEMVSISASGALTYSWSGGDTSSASPLGYHTGTAPGTQTLTIIGTSSLGCSSTKNVIIDVDACTNLNHYAESSQPSLFPNPFCSLFEVKGFSGTVSFYNSLGMNILEVACDTHIIINTINLAEGIYMVRLRSNDRQFIKNMNVVKLQ
jgi:hypothetical protein